MENFKMVAKTFFGFEEILAKELQQLGAQEVEIGTRMVSFKGDKGFMYKANLSLRSALKILKPIYHFRTFNDQSLYKGIQGIHRLPKTSLDGKWHSPSLFRRQICSEL